jgi:replicative DNA helicase
MDANEQNALKDYDGPDRVILSTDYWELIKNDKPPLKHLTGFNRLDVAIDGFESEELIVVSGPTGHGKTTFCRAVMMELASQGKRSLFFSYENSPKKIVSEHKLPETALYMPMDHRPMNILWLEKRCIEAALKYADLSAIFVDHLHYVVDMANRGNMSLEIGQTMRFLKQNIAVALNVPVFIVAHMTKIPPNEEPSISHLRDSSMVGCEADTVLVIWRQFSEDTYGKLSGLTNNRATLKVEKARREGTMGYKINLIKDGLRLLETI